MMGEWDSSFEKEKTNMKTVQQQKQPFVLKIRGRSTWPKDPPLTDGFPILLDKLDNGLEMLRRGGKFEVLNMARN